MNYGCILDVVDHRLVSQLCLTVQYKAAKVLYDFEAGDDNELNLMAGDIVNVTDDR